MKQSIFTKERVVGACIFMIFITTITFVCLYSISKNYKDPVILARTVYDRASYDFDKVYNTRSKGVLTLTRKGKCDLRNKKLDYLVYHFEKSKKKYVHMDNKWWEKFLREWGKLHAEDKDITLLMCEGGVL